MADLTGAFGGNAFDPSQVDEPQGFGPLPTDVDFLWEIVNADVAPTKSGDGTILKMRCNVLAPSHVGRVVFANFNIQNPSEQAMQIAAQQLGAICRALGIVNLSDSDELIGGQFYARCYTKRGKDGYEPQSELNYATIAAVGGSAPKAAPAKPAAPAAKTASAAKPPAWAKRAA